MTRYPLTGLRIRLAISVAASFAILLAAVASILYFELRGAWAADVDRSMTISAQAVTELFTTEQPEFSSASAAVVHVVTELAFGDRFLVALGPDGRRIAVSRQLPGSPDPATTDLSTASNVPSSVATPSGPVRLVVVPLPEGLRIVIGFSLGPLGARLRHLRLALALGGLLGLVAGVLVAVVVSREALRPLTELAEVADTVSDSLARGTTPFLAPPRLGPHDEVGRLQTAFHALIRRLDQAIATEREAAIAQRQFFADAAHELRTPLAILRNEIGVAMRTSTGTDSATLAGLEREAAHLGRVVSDILLLARGETGANLAQEITYLDDVASEAIVRSGRHPLADGRRIRVGRFEAVAVRGDPTLLNRAVVALIENALVHAAPSDIEVSVGEESNGEALAWISVTDWGPPIPTAAVDRIFDRFYRLKREVPGSGLGLPIVRWIASIHGGSVALDQAPDGTRKSFVIRLPAASRRSTQTKNVASPGEVEPTPYHPPSR